jgi:hypothetical protein
MNLKIEIETQPEIKKPTIQQLMNAYHYNHILSRVDNSLADMPEYDRNEFIFKSNERSLARLKHEDYNQLNFQQLIASIELNGLAHFNMQTFFGVLSGTSIAQPVNEMNVLYGSEAIHLDKYTSSFNCSSVGCIAGFALANAVDWVQPEWLKTDSRNHAFLFEQVACNYLNIPIGLGQMIFYGDEPNIWSFAESIDSESYDGITFTGYYDEDEDSEDCDWAYRETNLHSIDFKTAADVLRRVASGEFKWENDEYNIRGTLYRDRQYRKDK